MIHSKLLVLLFSVIAMSRCGVVAKNDGKNNDAGTTGTTNTTTNDTPPVFDGNNGNGGVNNGIYGVWSGGDVTSSDLAKYPFIKGWYTAFRWEKLEPTKDNFDWNYFDSQLKTAFDNNLSIGFMVWVGQHSPKWLYTYGVPEVSTTSKKRLTQFPFYLSPKYKERYFNMLDAVAAHIKAMPPAYKSNIVMWMSAEGSTGDISPYKGRVDNSAYEITEQQWSDFKKETWLHLNKLCKSISPRMNLLVNQGNDGRYFDWLTTNIPNLWLKAGNISHTYQFNGELEYFSRLSKLVEKTEKDSASSRMRGEITVQGTYFNQNESWNMYALLTSSLHFGLDIFNASTRYFTHPADTSTFNFFNFYAGHKVAAKSPGAFCVLRDGLDAGDTKRFPESVYGPVIDPAKMTEYNRQVQKKGFSDDGDVDDQGINLSNAKNENLSQTRIDKILAEYAPYGAKRGDYKNLPDVAATGDSGADDEGETVEKAKGKGKGKNAAGKQGKNGGKRVKQIDENGNVDPNSNANIATDYQLKRESSMVINDIGVNLIPDNYYKFLVQYSPNSTSRGYWRVGPGDQPYGRFARGFEAASGRTEMFFALDKKFFNGSNTVQKVGVKIVYLDKGNGAWSLNYYSSNGKREAYKINCGNSGNWITKTVVLSDAFFTQKLDHNCDVSIKYLSGDNTIFNSIEILR